MRITEGLDAGPVCLEGRVAIGPDMTAGELHDALAPLGAELMVTALAALEQGRLDCRPQADEGVTYAAKIDPRETRIDWRASRRARCTTSSAACRLIPAPGSSSSSTASASAIRALRSTLAEGVGRAGHAARRST